MKVLLDHNIPHALRHHFPEDCDVYTAHYCGWSELENGDLLRAAQEAAFSVFVTLDSGIAYQQSLKGYDLGIIFLRAHPATAANLVRLMPQVVEALPVAADGRHITVFD